MALRFDLSTCSPRAPDPDLIEKLAALLWSQCLCSAGPPHLLNDGDLSINAPQSDALLLSDFHQEPLPLQTHWRTVASACCASILRYWGATITPLPPPPPGA